MLLPHLLRPSHALAALCLVFCTSSRAQIDISLHPTAVADSFEVRMRSLGPTYSSIPNAVFTLAWDSDAGGVIDLDAGDVVSGCDRYNFTDVPPLQHGGRTYYTLLIFGFQPLGDECPITTAARTVAGVRIRGASGCHSVELTSDSFALANNSGYYISIGGLDRTGSIVSDPLQLGNCGPCVAPAGLVATGSILPCAEERVSFQAWASGNGIYSWTAPNGTEPFAWGTDAEWDGPVPPGAFTVVAHNECGSDTVQVVPTTAPCTPPVINSIQPSGIFHTATVSGSCPSFRWYRPDGTLAGQLPSVELFQTGLHRLIVENACGADTMDILVNQPCAAPIITAIQGTTQFGCDEVTDLDLQAIVNAPNTNSGVRTFTWRDPSGTVVGGSGAHLATQALNGTWQVSVADFCGFHQLSFQVLVPDTTGLADCTPPHIEELVMQGAACAGDTLHLFADVQSNGPCTNYTWRRGSTVLGNGAQLHTPAITGDYSLVLQNACGSDTAQLAVHAITSRMNVVFCDLDHVVDLDQYLPPDLHGAGWIFDGAPHSGSFDPALDSNGVYFNAQDLYGCPPLEVHLISLQRPYAGRDTSIVICSTDAPLDLMTLLGDPDTVYQGGTWYIGPHTMSGIYHPEVHGSGLYIYEPFKSVCGDRAHVTVTEVQATTWYADADGDGAGDPAVSFQGCVPPDGYVANDNDGCPQHAGVFAPPCGLLTSLRGNKGSPAPPSPGMVRQGVEGASMEPLLWPNPNDGEALYLSWGTDPEQAEVCLIDATGRTVLQSVLHPEGGRYQLRFGTALSAGVFRVRITTASGTRTLPLVVR